MPPQSPQHTYDIVTAAIALASMLFGPIEAARIIGTYSVIVLAALGGAAWYSINIPTEKRRDILLHMALRVGLALLVTVPLAGFLADTAGFPVQWAFGPLAAVVAAKPQWTTRLLEGFFTKRPPKSADPEELS